MIQLRTTRYGRAFSLVEVLMSLGLVGGLLVVSLNTLGGSTLGRRTLADRGNGRLLGMALMTEILQQNYSDPQGGTGIGPDAGESSSTRNGFDDVDDYHNWSDYPPTRKKGVAYAVGSGWNRTVTVDYVTPSDLTTPSFTDQGYKRITITVTHNGEVASTLVAVRCGSQPPELKVISVYPAVSD